MLVAACLHRYHPLARGKIFYVYCIFAQNIGYGHITNVHIKGLCTESVRITAFSFFKKWKKCDANNDYDQIQWSACSKSFPCLAYVLCERPLLAPFRTNVHLQCFTWHNVHRWIFPLLRPDITRRTSHYMYSSGNEKSVDVCKMPLPMLLQKSNFANCCFTVFWDVSYVRLCKMIVINSRQAFVCASKPHSVWVAMHSSHWLRAAFNRTRRVSCRA